MRHRHGDGTLDLVQLRTFLAVYRCGSLTAAATQVGLSQPTVTSQLRTLEKAVGRPLFDRLPRGVSPTAAAHELAARIADPLDALAEVTGITAAHTPPEPPVQLGGPAEFLAALALPALAPLVAEGVRLQVTTGLADDLLTELHTGALDLVISAIRPRGRAVLAEPLADEEFVLVADPATAARIDTGRLERGDASALTPVPLVSYATDLPILRRYWRHVFGRRLERRPAVVVPDLRAVLAVVAAGGGVSVVPRYLCASALATGTVVALLDPQDPPINTAYLVGRSTRTERPHVALVRARLRDAASTW